MCVILIVVLAVVLGTGTYSIWIMNGHISLAALSMIDHRSITAALLSGHLHSHFNLHYYEARM